MAFPCSPSACGVENPLSKDGRRVSPALPFNFLASRGLESLGRDCGISGEKPFNLIANDSAGLPRDHEGISYPTGIITPLGSL